MALVIPRYLRDAGIQDPVIRYEWDDWEVEKAYEPLDEEFLARMEGISQRGNIAFTAACAEWISFRYAKLSDDPDPMQVIEAAWAAMVDWRYARYFDPDDEDWQGPIRRPIEVALVLLVEAIDRTEKDDHPAIDSASIGNLAEHLITDPAPFRAWRDRVVARLERLHPLDPGDTRGTVVPREAMDPDFDFDPGMTEDLVRRFLASLDPRSNPWLQSPEEMIACGFEGTPYAY